MKINISNLFLAFALGLIMFSCAKDNGNYNYTDIPKIGINDESTTGTLFVQQGVALKLNPEVQLNGNKDDLSYEWFVYLNSASASYVQDSTKIATSKNLDYVIDPKIFTIGENYKLTYKVTNKATGISSFYFYQISISDLFTQGWMFLEDKSGKADLSMILNNGTVYHDIYSFRNSESPLYKPKAFSISNASISDDVGPSGKKYYIVADKDAVELDGTTMKKRFDYNYLFFAPPTVINPQYMAWGGSSGNNVGIIVNEGHVHINMVGGFPGAKKFGAQLRAPQHGYDYELAPQHISGNTYTDTYNVIMFDARNQRFYGVTTSALNSFDDANQTSSIFDMNNIGLDLIKLDSSNIIEIRNAVMKDNDGKGYLLQFRTHRNANNPSITIGKQEINAPGISSALDVSSSTLSPHLFYANNTQLIRYEVTSNAYTSEYTFPANETVTKIKFQKHGYGNAVPRLIVTTWNGTEGKVYFFKITQSGSVEGLDKTFTGFGKIIDLAYKY
ncbi:PKD-like family lipoprotein [Sphingobacterium sp. HJSM2_6]|uniref:PKD-like family lipoprotein n=1 Tax=Sphingobacterium sp. HJSM2_6 TaxID=3366264 RepID=UPI003BD65438